MDHRKEQGGNKEMSWETWNDQSKDDGVFY